MNRSIATPNTPGAVIVTPEQVQDILNNVRDPLVLAVYPDATTEVLPAHLTGDAAVVFPRVSVLWSWYDADGNYRAAADALARVLTLRLAGEG